MSLADVFATNLFPYIKRKGMQGALPFADLLRAARMFGVPQIKVVAPRLVICLGLATFNAIRVACALPRFATLDEASRSHFTLDGAEIWCQAHTGARGQQNRGRTRADSDWNRMARWYVSNDA
jgi:restriction system protein